MGCDQCFSLVQVLKNHHRGTCQRRCVKGVSQFHGPIGTIRGKLQLRCDLGLFLAHQKRLTGDFVHEDTAQFIGLAHLQVLVGHGVHDGDFSSRFRSVLAINCGSSADLRHPFKLVVDGAQADGSVVSADSDVGDLHQLIALVPLTGQFFQSVLVIR